MGELTAGEFAKLLAADRYLAEVEHGWRCPRCIEERKQYETCVSCGAPYEEEVPDARGGMTRKVYRGTQVFDQIAEQRKAQENGAGNR